MPAVVVERMLDGLDARVAELVGARGDAQALVVIVGGGAVFGPERGEEIDAEFHGFIVSAVRSRAATRASGRLCVSPDRPPCARARRNASGARPARALPTVVYLQSSAPAHTRCCAARRRARTRRGARPPRS